MSAGGSLKISDGAWLGRHSVEIRERNGQLEHRYYVNGSERPFEPEGPRLAAREPAEVRPQHRHRRAGARGAPAEDAAAPPAVMAEIGRIDATYVKGIYYRELFKQALADAGAVSPGDGPGGAARCKARTTSWRSC